MNAVHLKKLSALAGSIQVLRQDQSKLTDQVSLESLSRQIKYKTDLMVELFDEGVMDLHKQLVKFFDTFDYGSFDLLKEYGHRIHYVLNTQFDYVEKRMSWRFTDETIAKMREPVIAAYDQLFHERTAINAVGQQHDIEECVATTRLINSLKDSEIVKHIPTLFLMKNSIDKVQRFSNFIEALDQAVELQSDNLNTILTRALDTLKRGELISDAEKIEMDKTSIQIFGITFESEINKVVAKNWYGVDTRTRLSDMLKNLQSQIEEPKELFTPVRETIAEDAISYLVITLADQKFAETLRQIVRRSQTLSDKLKQRSDQLTRFTDEINDVPHKSTDGYYNYALEDISMLISTYSAMLFELMSFIVTIDTGLNQALKQIKLFTDLMENYRSAVERYVNTRKSIT